MTRHEIEILPDPAAVARRGAAVVAAAARRAVAARGRFTFAVSGGTTPWAMFGYLAGEEMPWSSTAIYQVDERIAPEGDPDRNLTHLVQSLGDAPADVHAMPVDDPDLEAAAAAYAADLPERFDLVHLGLGDDGHTASLVPGDPVLDVADRAVAVTADYRGRRRMTLTYAGAGARRPAAVARHRRGQGGAAREAPRLRPVDPCRTRPGRLLARDRRPGRGRPSLARSADRSAPTDAEEAGMSRGLLARLRFWRSVSAGELERPGGAGRRRPVRRRASEVTPDASDAAEIPTALTNGAVEEVAPAPEPPAEIRPPADPAGGGGRG